MPAPNSRHGESPLSPRPDRSRIVSQTLDSEFDQVDYRDVFAELPSKPEATDGWDPSF